MKNRDSNGVDNIEGRATSTREVAHARARTRCPASLIFGSLVLFALFVAFACGHLTGRLASVPTPTFDASHTDKLAAVSEILVDICHGVRRQEYLDLEDALRRQKEYAPAEHAPVIDECLRVLRESWKERAKQEPTSLYRAE